MVRGPAAAALPQRSWLPAGRHGEPWRRRSGLRPGRPGGRRQPGAGHRLAAGSAGPLLAVALLPLCASARGRAARRARTAARATRTISDEDFASALRPQFDVLSNFGGSQRSSKKDLFSRRPERYALSFQDALYKRYNKKTGALPPGDPEYRVRLLQKLRMGDVEWLEDQIERSAPGSWDFIYPPGRDQFQGWCRSPLSLLVRPKEAFFQQRFMPGVPYHIRLSLIHKALQSGVCSPHIEGTYWSCPAVHAALDGDVNMLKELHGTGLDLLNLKLEWAGSTGEAKFTLAHAAAINGHRDALVWMVEALRPDGTAWLDMPDANGNTPLFHAVHTARSAEAALFLLEKGCNPFRCNPAGRSPLSAAIELLPDVAYEFLETKNRRMNAWWGNPVVAFDFEGVAVDPETDGQLRFASEAGDYLSIEGLITRTGNAKLASAPIMKRLVDKKWDSWARERYFKIFGFFALLTVSYIWEAIAGIDMEAAPQLLSFGCTYFGWFGYAWTQILEFESRGPLYLSYGWNIIDTMILFLVPVGAVPHIFDALDLRFPVLSLSPMLEANAVIFDAFLLLMMAVRLCRFIAVISEARLALYLRAVLDILALSWKPLAFVAIVVASFAMAFTLLFRVGVETHPSYYEVTLVLIRWLFQPDDALTELKQLPMEIPGFVFFILYISVALLGSLRLVQDSVNLQQVGTDEEAERQFQAVRAEVIDDIEQQMLAGPPDDKETLFAFYQDLRESGKTLQLESLRKPL